MHPKRETDHPERSLSNYGEWRTGITTPKTPPVSRKGRKRKEMAREKPGLSEVERRKSLYLRADGTGEKR